MRQVNSFGWIDAALLSIVIIWGANFAITKSALAEMRPMVFNALRFALASLFTLALAWILERDLHIPRRDWGYVFSLGLIGNFLYQILYINGLARSRAGNTSLILAAAPVFIAVFGTLAKQDKLSRRNWLGIFISFCGIVLLVYSSGPAIRVGDDTLVGSLLVLAAAGSWSAYTILVKPLVQRYPPIKTTAWIMASTTPLLILSAVPDLQRQNWRAVTVQSWLGLLYSSVLAIAIAYVIWNTGVRRVGGTRTAVYQYLTPLVSVIVAWIVLGENMRPLQALAGVAILVGVALGRRHNNG